MKSKLQQKRAKYFFSTFTVVRREADAPVGGHAVPAAALVVCLSFPRPNAGGEDGAGTTEGGRSRAAEGGGEDVDDEVIGRGGLHHVAVGGASVIFGSNLVIIQRKWLIFSKVKRFDTAFYQYC